MAEFDARPNLKRPEANPSLPPKLHLLQFKDCDKSVNINPIATNLAYLVDQCTSYKLTKFQLISCTKILGMERTLCLIGYKNNQKDRMKENDFRSIATIQHNAPVKFLNFFAKKFRKISVHEIS